MYRKPLFWIILIIIIAILWFVFVGRHRTMNTTPTTAPVATPTTPAPASTTTGPKTSQMAPQTASDQTAA